MRFHFYRYQRHVDNKFNCCECYFYFNIRDDNNCYGLNQIANRKLCFRLFFC